MKRNVFTIGVLTAVLFTFASCKDEKQANAEKTVNNYVVYVDSLGNVASDEAKTNWQIIEDNYQLRISQAEASLNDAKDSEALRDKIEASKAKYEALKAKYQAEMQSKTMANNPSQVLRDGYFGEGKVGEDMNFSWVDKDNILKVYETFFESYKNNKGSFTREDYDETKLIYEALDSRKNTVEKEGLSSEDNGKIASIKLKFAPMFKVNRVGAKAREMEEAKE